MKRVLSIGLVLALVSMVFAADVPSVNVAGFVRKSLAAGELTIVGVNLDGIGSPQTLQSLFGDDAVANANFVQADWFTTFDEVGKTYQRYAMYTDGEFYKCNTRAEWEDLGATAQNPTLDVGSALWVRCNSGGANEFSVTGEAVMDVSKQVDLVSGLQMVCYPLSSEIDIDSLDLPADGATANGNFVQADQIFTWEGSGYQKYALYTDNKWYGCNTRTEWESGPFVLGSDRVLKVGEGFWYNAKGAVTWTEDNQYLASL